MLNSSNRRKRPEITLKHSRVTPSEEVIVTGAFGITHIRMCWLLVKSLRQVAGFEGTIIILARRRWVKWFFPDCHVVTTSIPPMLARMHMDELLPELCSVEKVAWLDTDVLVLRPGMKEFFDLKGKALRVVHEVGITLGKTTMRPFIYFLSEEERSLHAEKPGVNSGTLCCSGRALKDLLSIWRKTHYHEGAAAPRRFDQASLNAILVRGEWTDYAFYSDDLVQFPLVADQRGHAELIGSQNLLHHYIGLKNRKERLRLMRRELHKLINQQPNN